MIPWTEVSQEEGTGIVHIAPGCGEEDFLLGKEFGLPRDRAARRKRRLRRRLRLADRAGRSAMWRSPIADDLRAKGVLFRARAVPASLPALLALRHRAGLPPGGRVVHQHGRAARHGHGRHAPDPLDPRIRAGARAGLAAQHARLDDLQEALLGPGAADLVLRRAASGPRSSADATSCEQRAVEGLAEFEGHSPHRPWIDAVKIACGGCGKPISRIPDVGNPWLDAGIVPFSTLHYRTDPDYWQQLVPGRLHHRELSRPVPQLVLLAAGDEHGAREPAAVQDRARPRHGARRRRPADAQEHGQRHRLQRRRRTRRRRRHALDLLPARTRPPTSTSAGKPPTRRKRRLLKLWDSYKFFVLYAVAEQWQPAIGRAARRPSAPSSIAGCCRG